MNDLSLFYRELVLAWEKFSVCKNLTGSQISTQSLWNNKFIHSKSKSLYDHSLVSKGIIYVSNLFNRKGEMKNWETVSQEFNLNPVHFLKWYGVLKSIPSSWKKALRSHSVQESMISEESQCGIEANGKFIPINGVTAKLVDNLCISHKFSPPTSKKLLSTKFNIEDQKTWSSVYLLPASTTLGTKIRMFQYKILNNILYLNQRLYDMKLVASPLCSLCKREFETAQFCRIKGCGGEGCPPPPPIIFERLKLPQQIIYRRKGDLSESPNHEKYWENILVSRFYEQF